MLGDAGQQDVVSGLLSRIATLQAAVASTEAQRRKLHNELVDARGNVRALLPWCHVPWQGGESSRRGPDCR